MRYIYKWNLQILNNVTFNKKKCSPSGIDKQLWLSYLEPLVFLLPKTFKLFDFPIFWHWSYLMKVISRNARCALNYISTSLLPVMKHPTITNNKKRCPVPHNNFFYTSMNEFKNDINGRYVILSLLIFWILLFSCTIKNKETQNITPIRH
jgi:hypothetical protein